MTISERQKYLINSMIEKAIQEEMNAIGFADTTHLTALRAVKYDLARKVGERITGDIGRMRRLLQICKSKTGGRSR